MGWFTMISHNIHSTTHSFHTILIIQMRLRLIITVTISILALKEQDGVERLKSALYLRLKKRSF